MFPNRELAQAELLLAGRLNPGAWVEHSRHAALAAEHIASCIEGMDCEKAYVCGLLHDIGRRTGIFAMRHIIDGYDYATEKGWDEVARVCLTHSFPVKDIEADIGKKDITQAQYRFVETFLKHTVYDDYDKLIILCDALADSQGLCILEKRFIDTARRYGFHPCSIDRWNQTFAYQAYFEEKIGASIYSVLPNIEQCIYR